MKLHNLKKVIATIFVGVLIIVNSACNSSSKDYTKTVPSVKEEVSPKIKSTAQPEEIELPEDFKDKAFTHIEQLCSYGDYANVPEWLRKDINTSCSELNYNFVPAHGMGSDHESFMKYGIPAENICVGGNEDTHSPKDTQETVNKDSLTIVGRIDASVVNYS